MDETATGYGEKEARYYDAEMSAVDREDVSFYTERAVEADGPVLELACGTGRVYLELLERGVDADGLDASEAALAILRENAAERGVGATVWRGELADFDVEREYALVICPFNTLQHLLTVEEQLAAFQQIHDALAPGGQFVFDVFVPSFDVVCETYGEWTSKTVEHRGAAYEHRSRSRMADEVEQQFLVETELTDSAGEEVFSSEHQLKMLPKREVELLARLSPFSEWQVTGDFGDAPVTDGDSIQVWNLEK